MANLIKNGDFSQQGNEWTASNPQDVSYASGHCAIAPPGSISQDVITGNGGEFMLLAKVKTNSGFATGVELKPHPTGPTVYLVGASQDWTIIFQRFTAPIGTIKFTVKLEANDGAPGTLGAHFSDVILVRL